MDIHVVTEGETIGTIANDYGVTVRRLIEENGVKNPDNLVIGQTLIIPVAASVYTVQDNDTLYSIAVNNGITVNNLLQNNPAILQDGMIYPGEELVISFDEEKLRNINTNGYVYTYVDREVLISSLPYLTYLSIFGYGFTETGDLVYIDDDEILSLCRDYGVAPVFVLTTLTEGGQFSNTLASKMFHDLEFQNLLLDHIIAVMGQKGYKVLDIDFEFILPEDRDAFTAFINNARLRLNPFGYDVTVAVAPKTSADQPGMLYEAHDYKGLGEAANALLLMTYEWGYTYGPPMAVSPINKVREVLDYAVTEIPPNKINMGIPNYGYDWKMPFEKGVSRARLIGNEEAIEIAARYGVAINYDELSQAPNFTYYNEAGEEHVVWFEDARSMDAKLNLIVEYGFLGAGYWNLMREFTQNWMLVAIKFNINKIV